MSETTAQSACDGRFEGETIRFIVPHHAGGGYDTYTRMIAPLYAEATGSRTVVENWPGGKGLIGANKITSAKPDGLSFGIVSAPKLLASELLGDPNAPDLLDDFRIFARVARIQHVWLVNANSGVNAVDGILSADPLSLYGTTDIRSVSLMAALLTTELLKFDFEIVTGLGGTKKRVLALIRNDIDFMSVGFSSVRADLESGAVRAVLQVSSAPIEVHPALAGVPLLGGTQGFAARRARQLGTDVEAALNLAAATEVFAGAGRLFVGPAGFEPELAACIESTFMEILSGDALRSAAKKLHRPLDIAGSRATISALAENLPILREHVQVIGRKTQELTQ